MYKLQNANLLFGAVMSVTRLSDNASIPFDPQNTDFSNFKKAINEGTELQDAEGNVMTAEQAQDFIKELP